MVKSVLIFSWPGLLAVCTILNHKAEGKNEGDSHVLSSLINQGKIEEARKLSSVDPNKFHGIKSYSGFITVKEEYNSNLFFWFFPHHEKKLSKTPWVIWLQGGPGYSSMKGLFGSIGPFEIKDGEAELRNTTWTSDYSMLFLDNPVGAGFSFTDDDRGYPDNEDDVGGQMYTFLNKFLELFPDLRDAPLFLAGESYAGKYVPALGIQIHRKRDIHRINMKGLFMGNPMVDPPTILSHYSELCANLGLLDEDTALQLQELELKALKFYEMKKMVDAANKFNETIEFIKSQTGVNIYNFEKDPSDTKFEYEGYLKKLETRSLIHVGNSSFHMNNQYVYKKMLPDIMNTTKPFVEALLEHYPVMIYMGQYDLILPYSCLRHSHRTMRWSGREEFIEAHRRRLRRSANGSIVGYKKSGGNFTEIVVRGCGHMVTEEQPEVAKFLIDMFIQKHK